MAGIELTGLSTVYPNGVRAVDDLSLSVVDGEFFALLGPSGCGKTTLLRTIAGLEQATSGAVSIGGVDVTRAEPGRRKVAMVFQDYALFPHMTVEENVGYGLRVRRWPKAKRQRRVDELLAMVKLEDQRDKLPRQLSGGQQQRVALARALAVEQGEGPRRGDAVPRRARAGRLRQALPAAALRRPAAARRRRARSRRGPRSWPTSSAR